VHSVNVTVHKLPPPFRLINDFPCALCEAQDA